MLRIILFVVTNLAILLLLGIMMTLFGLDSRSTGGLLIMAAVFGMGGSFISLALSKWIAKKSTGASPIITPKGQTELWLHDTVAKLAKDAGIGMPEVAIYQAPEMNAFATGMKKDNALVAVSTGLLENMNRDEVEAVLAHEISHIACGDMVTLSLIQGVLNTFVIFLSRLAANAINTFMSDEEGEGGLGFFGYIGVTIVLELFLGLFASMIVMWFSRRREFVADRGGAYLTSNEKMINALQKLQEHRQPSMLPEHVAAFGIRPKENGLSRFFVSHPPIPARIEALRKLQPPAS